MQNLYRLANVMGLDAQNAQHTIALKEAMHTIADEEDFINFCRTQKDGVEYSTKVEKLDTLSTRYKSTINNIPMELLEKFSREIADKFKIAEQILRDNEAILTEKGLVGLVVDHQQYFTNKEIELLEATGGLNRLINLLELGTLYESLYTASVKKTLEARKYTALTDGQKKVKALIGGK